MNDLRIPGYEILEPIGEGGMGTVYKARQISLGRLVAIKVLRDDLAADPSALAQFKLEANSVANLKHPNIVLLHEAGELDGRHYFVMEYVSAYSVQEWLTRKGRIDESDTLTIADAVAHALHYAWDRAGLVHCDIKPGNLLVDEDGIVKVADFSGLSHEPDTPESRLVAEMTIGTPNYMAPEQVRGLDDLDFRTDIYALGAVLYHLLSGRLPFANLSPAETMQCQISSHLPDPREDAPDISIPMVLLIERLLIKDPAARPENWQAVRDDLRRVRNGQPPRGEAPPTGASTLRRSSIPAPSPIKPPAASRRRVVIAKPDAVLRTPRSRNQKRKISAVLGMVIGLLVANAFLAYRLWERRRSAPVEPEPVPHIMTDPVVTRPATPAPRPDPVIRPPTAERSPTREPVPPPPEIRRPPTVEWREAPTIQPDEATERPSAIDPEAFLAMLHVHRTALDLSRRGNFEAAEQVLREWHARNIDAPHAKQAVESARWLRRASGLGRLLERNAHALIGQSLPSRTAEGTIIEVARGQVRLRRILGPGGIAEIAVPYHEIGGDDMLTLLEMAEPEQAMIHAATYLLAQGRLTQAEAMLSQAEAEGLDTGEPRSWHEAWTALSRNLSAERQVQEAERLLGNHQFEECRATIRTLRDEWSDTDIVREARAERLRQLDLKALESIRRIPHPGARPPDDPPAGNRGVEYGW